MKLSKILEGEYGNILFGDKDDPAKFAKMQGAKPGSEPDSPEEKKLLLLLKKWTVNPAHSIQDLYKIREKLKSLANEYPKILKPSTPNGTVIYRGLTSTNPQIESQVKASNPEDWIKAGRLYILKTPIKYIPRSDIQSWSTRMETGMYSFGQGGMLISKQNEEYMMNQEALSILYPLSEDEILHFGKNYDQNVYFAGIDISNTIRKYSKKLANVKSVSDRSKDLDMKSVIK